MRVEVQRGLDAFRRSESVLFGKGEGVLPFSICVAIIFLVIAPHLYQFIDEGLAMKLRRLGSHGEGCGGNRISVLLEHFCSSSRCAI